VPSLYGAGAEAAAQAGLTGLNSATAFTVAAWVRFARRLNGVSGCTGVILTHASTANTSRDGFQVGFDSARLFMRIGGAAASTDTSVSIVRSRASQFRWAHYVWAFDNATNRVSYFRNGALQGHELNTRDMTVNALCTTRLNAGVVGSVNGEIFDVQHLPSYAVEGTGEARLLADPRRQHHAVRGRWCGLGFRSLGASATLRDESGNGNDLTSNSIIGRCTQSDEPPYLPTFQ